MVSVSYCKLILIAALLVLFAAGCGEDVIELEEVEITEYQGQDLSSAATDFRENSIEGPQYIDRESYRLEISGLVENPRSYTYDEVISYPLYKKVARLDCVEGWSVNILWEGILLRDLFEEAAVKPEANTVILYAVDGYSTSFPLDYFYDRDILMAYRMNEIEIPPERGFPFVLVAEDKWGYKWIKWIDKIELSDNAGYEGYWESRGYSKSGDRDKPRFEQ